VTTPEGTRSLRDAILRFGILLFEVCVVSGHKQEQGDKANPNAIRRSLQLRRTPTGKQMCWVAKIFFFRFRKIPLFFARVASTGTTWQPFSKCARTNAICRNATLVVSWSSQRRSNRVKLF
jgi:hypothetical protein